MLQKNPLSRKINFDTAENGPFKVSPLDCGSALPRILLIRVFQNEKETVVHNSIFSEKQRVVLRIGLEERAWDSRSLVSVAEPEF